MDYNLISTDEVWEDGDVPLERDAVDPSRESLGDVERRYVIYSHVVFR